MSFKTCAFLLALSLPVVPAATAQTSPRQFIAPYAFSPEPQNLTQSAAYWDISDIAGGDIDGDGKPDLVIGVNDMNNNTPPNYLEWLKGNGDGTFVVKQFSTPITDTSFQLADVNGDGILDLITAGSALNVYINNGDATFKAPQSYLQFDQNIDFLPANFSGGPRPDIAVLAGGVLQMLLNRGDGTFRAGQSTQVFQNGIIGAADFDGDGHIDLALGSGAILFGAGDGTFPPAAGAASYPVISYPVISDLNSSQQPLAREAGPNRFSPESLSSAAVVYYSRVRRAAILDANRDGHPDIVEAGGDRAIVLLNNGDGSFRGTEKLQKPLRYVAGSDFDFTTCCYSVMTGDFNHDGNPDFVVGPSEYLGNGDGTFRIFKFLAGSGRPEIMFDVNQDGNPDLMWVDESDGIFGGYIHVALGSANGLFRTPFETVAPDHGIPEIPGNNRLDQPIVSGDFNRDGIMDVAVRCQGGKLCVFPGTGRSYFDPLTLYEVFFNGLLLVGDLNGDGFLDLVGTNSPAGVRNYDIVVLLGKGDGTFRTPNHYLVLNGGPAGRFVSLFDVNNDHKLDLVGPFGIAFGKGDGTFETAKPLPVNADVRDVAVLGRGDFNRDGFIDLVVNVFNAGNLILFGDGSGNFPKSLYYNGPVGGLAVADVNKDGILDLLSTTSVFKDGQSQLKLAVAFGNGDGTFQPPSVYPYPNHFSEGNEVLVADFDRDGIMDAIVTGYRHVKYFRGLPGGKFASPQEFATAQTNDVNPPEAKCQYTFLDINGDGYLDIAVADRVMGITRLLNAGAPAAK